jgi:hypothetical protein
MSNLEKVKKVSVILAFNFVKSNGVNYGLLHAEVEGYDISDAAITGWLKSVAGAGKTPVLSTSDSK